MTDLKNMSPKNLDRIAAVAARIQTAALIARSDGDFLTPALRLGLDEAVLASVVPAVLDTESGTDGAGDHEKTSWKNALLYDVLGRQTYDRVSDAQDIDIALRRLRHCLRAIPLWADYDGLIRSYVKDAKTECPREGRPDDERVPADAGGDHPAEEKEQRLRETLDFLRDEDRVRYIASGRTDLRPVFSREEYGILNGMAVYVGKDIMRLDDNAILGIDAPEHMLLPLIVKIAAARRDMFDRYGPLATKKKDD